MINEGKAFLYVYGRQNKMIRITTENESRELAKLAINMWNDKTIDKEYRNNGYAKELLFECEQWAKGKKCV